MSPDGSNLKQLTTDGAVKFSLQWSPAGDKVFYISGKCIGMVDLNGNSENLACFNSAQYLEDFKISPVGDQIAIALDRTLYVVPFDMERFKMARNHNDLINMNGCLTYSELASKGADWSSDGKKLAVKIIAPQGGVKVDMVRVMDISTCGSTTPHVLDTFPGPRFTMIGYNDAPYIPSFDWDGGSLFLLNSRVRNNVYGYLYAYNVDTQHADQLDPLQTGCCYADARWSPDGLYVMFAYQDISLGANSRNLLYLVPFGTIGTSANYTPLPLPDNFLVNPSEHPEAVFRPVR
jgi:Tol biopolymer transport system component